MQSIFESKPGLDEGNLSESEKYQKRLEIALKAAKICVFEVDLRKQLYTFFANSEDIFGVPGDRILADVAPFSKLPSEEYQKAASRYFSHPDDFAVIDQAFQCIFRGEATTYEARMRAGGSDYIWCKLDVSPIMKENVPVRMIGVITNIEKQKARAKKLEHAAKLDTFTGLFNKAAAIDMIKEALRQNPQQRHALVLLDIDNFKDFNDTYGHVAGDVVIKLVADSLKQCFRNTDIAGRYGGDEFIVLMEDVRDISWVGQRLQKLIRCEGDGFRCTTSMGVAVFPQDGSSYEQLFLKADLALYNSKVNRSTLTYSSNLKE